MDCGPAYQSLLELFPQVDSRILKAVAIEHSNDVNAAVEFILYEVLPSLSQPSDVYNPVHDSPEIAYEVQLREHNVNNQGDEALQPEPILSRMAVSDESISFASAFSGVAEENITDVERFGTNNEEDETLQPESIMRRMATSDESVGFVSPFSGVTEENIIDVQWFETNNQGDEALQPELIICSTATGKKISSFTSPFSEVAKEGIIDVEKLETNNHSSSLSVPEEHTDIIGYGSLVEDINRSVSECEEQLPRCSVDDAITTVAVASKSANEMTSSVNEKSMDSVQSEADLLKDTNDAFGENEDYSKHLAENHYELLACETDMASLEDLPMIRSTRSGHIINIDLLEDCVTDAKSNKKTLVSAMESVVDMMREAEVLEERAKQAKKEASSAGQDILMKVDELKQMLQHAKQANDMHAGEVYGEKAILSTEARELQSRLLNLSDERNKSISVIEEIRETLEARLAVAKDEIAAAEQEKLEKEGLAKKALKEQEAFMDTIVQDSKRLQQEAQENAKLREFLVDRGQIVDTLQGEIAVICEDVMLLKKRVDDRAPLKGSLLMRTYSSASASSSFSHKSISSADGLLTVELGENTREGSEDSVRSQEQEIVISLNVSKEANASDKLKSTSVDDWEFLRREACLF